MDDNSRDINRNILFVDDEPKVLEGLKRMLRVKRHNWSASFAESGNEALSILENGRIDVVISDMRMPGMSGLELLSEVKERYPHIVRIILSGESDQDLSMKAVNVSHQFLNKPCDGDKLKSAIARTCRLSSFLHNDAIKRSLSRIDSLPSLPSIYSEIIAELQSAEPSIQKVGKIISRDMAMTAKILQLVNSAYFCLPRHISSPEHAVVILGLETIRSLVLVTQIFTRFKLEKFPASFLERLWNHNILTGQVAKTIAKRETKDAVVIDHSFMAGMLHDSGKLVLASSFPEKYMGILDRSKGQNSQELGMEREEFGISHAEAGAYLMELWGLPVPIIEAIAYHHWPNECMEKQFTPLTAVYAANILGKENGNQDQDMTELTIDEDYISGLNLTDSLPSWRQISCGTSEGAGVNGT